MKSKTITTFFVSLIIVFLYFFLWSGFKNEEVKITANSTIVTSTGPVKDFINVIYNNDYYGDGAKWSILDNISRYRDTLNYTGIQIYGGDQGGEFDSSLASYKVKINSVMTGLDASGLKVFYGRQKIEKLCYGQRLEYEAEGGNNGFSYQTRTAGVTTDSARTVVHACLPGQSNCPESDATPRYLCENILENLQQSDIVADFFSLADRDNWFLKPVMRIKQSDFSLSDTRPIVGIIIKKFDGNNGDTINIRVNNFRDSSGHYGGNYLSKFTFLLNDSLRISGNLTNGLNQGRNDTNINDCQIDFKIFWYGQVEVWFDKLIVDDEMGNNLFNANATIRNKFETKVTEEIAEFGDSTDHSSIYTYYADETVYSNIPCIKRVQELMKQTNPNVRLSCATTNYLNVNGMRNDTLGYRVFLDSIKPEIFTNDIHEVPWIIPNSLISTTPFQGAVLVSPSVYNEDLQYRFGSKTRNDHEGSLVYQLTFVREQRNSYKPDARLIVQPQLHANLVRSDSTMDYEGGREPTNEEIQSQAMISIAHGVDGLGWVLYQSFSLIFTNGSEQTAIGLLNFPIPVDTAKPRKVNHYGQNKWDYVCNMNKKILNWKPTLDKISWQDGYSVHSETAEHIYISDIKSIKRNPAFGYTDDPTCIYCDASNERYWEMGFFNPDSSWDKSKYFIMVNRRCVPDTPNYGTGDVRALRIKFNSSELTNFVNWKIIDVNNNSVVRTFDKDSNIFISMGEFQPGEGKLYKLAPVMQEGGTLVANEVCSGSFNCKDEVYNNGYDIKIIPATTISFSANGRIGMSGGKFSSGYSSQNQSSAPVVLKGLNNINWKGLNLISCNEVNITNTTFSNILPEDAGAIQLTNCLNTSLLNNTFNSTDNVYYGLSIFYILNADERNITLTINQNHFNNLNNPMKCISNGSTVIPIILDGNTFTTSSTGNTAILLSNISGGVIKNNSISNYMTGINFISSTADCYSNTITCNSLNSNSIIEESFSNINLGKSGKYYTGGHNNLQAGNNNILPDNSNFNIDFGYNIFNILNTASKHFDGTFPKTGSDVLISAVKNFFHINSTIQNPLSNVKYFETDNLVQFQFTPTNCIPFDPNEFIVFENNNSNDSSNSYNDTLFFAAEGSGEGMSSKNENKIKKTESENIKTLYDSVSIGIRMKTAK